MRHRMITGTGLGNPEPVILNNKGKISKKLGNLAVENYFTDGFDFEINKNYILFGLEPAYQYQKLKVICLHKDIKKSYIQTGIAWGVWGSRITKNTKYFSDYKRKSKFIKFIEEAHKIAFKGD